MTEQRYLITICEKPRDGGGTYREVSIDHLVDSFALDEALGTNRSTPIAGAGDSTDTLSTEHLAREAVGFMVRDYEHRRGS